MIIFMLIWFTLGIIAAKIAFDLDKSNGYTERLDVLILIPFGLIGLTFILFCKTSFDRD